MKYAILLILLIGLAACSSPPEDVQKASTVTNAAESLGEYESIPVNTAKSTFEFEGFGVGKSHVGTFETYSGELLIDNGVIIGGKGTINAKSVKSDSTGLNKHLKNEDFFDVEKYPIIEIESKSISDGMMVATLNFHGVTKDISIPVQIEGSSISSEFLLSMGEFGIVYKGVKDEVRISFNLVQ